MEFRRFNLGDFDYIYICKPSPKSAFFPPGELNDFLFSILRTLPKNLLQLVDPMEVYYQSKVQKKESPMRVSVLYEKDVTNHIKTSPLKESIKILLMAPGLKDASKVARQFVTAYPNKVFFIVTKKSPKVVLSHEKILRGPKDFARLLNIKNLFPGLDGLGSRQSIFNQVDFSKEITDLNPVVYFKPAQINYFTFNQILGTYWLDYDGDNQEEIIEESKKAVTSKWEDTERFKLIIDQLRTFNSFELRAAELHKTKFPNDRSISLSPLLVVSSYNYPHLSDLYEDHIKGNKNLQVIFKSLGHEQKFNYTNVVEVNDVEQTSPAILSAIGHLHYSKTTYLDGLGYLHASFTNSPCIRLPFLGNSLKRNLSFFRPDKVSNDITSIKKSIRAFGDMYARVAFPEGYIDEIFSEDRQIIAISDLPIEWLTVKELPLIATHDVCRMPENPLGGLMAYYGMNSFFKMSISKDILSKVMLLFCVDKDDPNYDAFDLQYKSEMLVSKDFNFLSFRCTSIHEVIQYVDHHQPQVLIFDCHGGYDKDTLSSYLQIGKEKMTGKEITEAKITAPIIFLSACFTNPTYGYVNGIANAFFEAGALSVTASYFPISIKNGTRLYNRIIRNLQYAANHPMHENWLEFVSHTIRTSYTMSIHEMILDELAVMNISDTKREEVNNELREDLVITNTGLLHSGLRHELLRDYSERLKTKIKSIVPTFSKNFDVAGSEHLFYTILGRADLIRFDVWMDEYHSLNKSMQGKPLTDLGKS
ncbi:MAG TPA: CHAT domain-containing protein [Cyclobacteriaceae bacterium]|nr:CHAT domain-containing protein [Cyclobacteriaceae bacterium]